MQAHKNYTKLSNLEILSFNSEVNVKEIYWNLTRLYQFYKTVGSPIKHGGQLKSWKSIFFLNSIK